MLKNMKPLQRFSAKYWTNFIELSIRSIIWWDYPRYVLSNELKFILRKHASVPGLGIKETWEKGNLKKNKVGIFRTKMYCPKISQLFNTKRLQWGRSADRWNRRLSARASWSGSTWWGHNWSPNGSKRQHKNGIPPAARASSQGPRVNGTVSTGRERLPVFHTTLDWHVKWFRWNQISNLCSDVS